MSRYKYHANLETAIVCSSVQQLVAAINSHVGFPVVTFHSLNNYFTRQHKMQRLAAHLSKFDIKRVSTDHHASTPTAVPVCL